LDVDEVLALSIASANRDQEVWGVGADVFRPERFADPSAVPSHLGFGLGAHFCAGAALARMSARYGLQALLAATSDLALDPAWRYEKVRYHGILRPKTLMVTFDAHS
jgi:cytochrome P450